MEQKVRKKYIDETLGFPVILMDVPMRKTRGTWVPNINYQAFKTSVLHLLAFKPSRLSGAEVKFIRHTFEMSTEAFGERFGDVSHPAVLKWEKKGQAASDMNWSTEKDIRMEILRFLNEKPKEIVGLYESLEKVKPAPKKPLQMPADDLAA